MQILNGLHVLITRPEEKGLELQEQLAALGASSVLAPMLQIEPITPKTYAPAFINMKPDLLIATSVNAVNTVGAYIIKHHKTWLAQLPIIGVGPATAAALHLQGWKAVAYPKEFNSEGILAMRATSHIRGKTVLIMTGAFGRNLLEPALNERGAKVLSIHGYQRQATQSLSQPAQDLLAKQPVIVVLTSTEAWRTFAALSKTLDVTCLSKAVFVAASTRIAEVMRQSLPTQTILVAEHAGNEAIVAAICHWFEDIYHE